MLVVFVGAGLCNAQTRPLYVREGDRLAAAAAYLLAGVKAEYPPSAGVSASASADAGSASGGTSDAGAARDPKAAIAKSDAGGERTPAEIFKDSGPAVVAIFVASGAGGGASPFREGGGTGFLIDTEGTIATNHHVIENAAHARIKFKNGTIYEDIEILEDAKELDLALLRVNLAAPVDGGARPVLSPVSLGNSDAVAVGEHAVVIGNPLGLEHTLTDGLVSSRRMYEGRAWIQFSAPISPGNSGGPLFNMREEVIGITTATISALFMAQNLNLAVPVNELKTLIRPPYPGRRKLGDGSAPTQW
jgi:S1-C subfamily serine protease